jgi:hypothetical protein
MNCGQTFTAESLSNANPPNTTIGRRYSSSEAGNSAFQMRGGSMVINNIFSGPVEYGSIIPPTVNGVKTHTMGTFDTSRLKLYINGLLDYDCTSQAVNQPAGGDLYIGSIQTTAGVFGESSVGVLDEIAFYGTTLTAADAQAHAQAAGFSVTPWTFTSVAATARAIFSLRSVNGYSGALIDVRRSSDNATNTINVVSGELDTATLASWGGASSVYVSKWYDQSGNANHLLQATNGAQPRIVNAGTLETINSKPIINCLAGTYLRESATSIIGTTDSVMTMCATDTGKFSRGQDTFGAGWSISGPSVVFTATGAASYSGGGTDSNSFGMKSVRIKNVTGASVIARDDTGYQVGANTNTTNYNFRTSTVGCEIGRTNGSDAVGKFGEVFVWTSLMNHGQEQAIYSSSATRFAF